MRHHDDEEGGRDRDEWQDRSQPVDGREDDTGRGEGGRRGELDVDGRTFRDPDTELADARLDRVEGRPQEVGAIDDERIVFDPDRAVGVVEADQRVVRGLDEPQAGGRDPGMVEGRLDARFEATIAASGASTDWPASGARIRRLRSSALMSASNIAAASCSARYSRASGS